MKIKAEDVKPGMRVWSNMLDEYFVVGEVVRDDKDIRLIDGLYTMRVRGYALVEVKDERSI